MRNVARVGAGLLLAPLMLWTPGSATGTPVDAPASVPTCRGVPATIVGTAGADKLVGTTGDDVIFGGGGGDRILGRRGNDLICGGRTPGRPFDFFQVLFGGPGDDTLAGGPGGEIVWGGAGADVLIGNEGLDLMAGQSGRDTLRGGPGSDDLNGNEGSDRLVGGRGSDGISDDGGANGISGGDGSDFIRSGPGNETIDGGRGRDKVSFVLMFDEGDSVEHCNAITVDLSLGTASGAGFGVDALQSIERVATGGGNDALTGDEGPNDFYAGFPCPAEPAPTESITGNGGADRVLFQDLPNNFAPGPVRIDLRNQTARLIQLDDSPPVLFSLDSIENVRGTDHRDVILGDAGPNLLDGGIRSVGDVIDGGGGADVLLGRRGNDQFAGGTGADVLLGKRGNDNLDGGAGRNRNDGGTGVDTCLRPSRGSLAISCER
jgi:Ca2+-binding RTX toxin-like protein